MTETTARLVLKPRKARPFFGRHPWVLDSAVERVEGGPADGDVVELYSGRGEWIARGLYNGQSRIRLRLYTWRSDEPLDEQFWRRRLQAAIDWRAALCDPSGQRAMRLVFSEGDGLSGLIVDRYGDYLVVQFAALAIAQRAELIVGLLVELLHPRGVIVRYDRDIARLEGARLEGARLEGLAGAVGDEVAWGEAPAGPAFIEEHGIRYGVDLSVGQKTGFFLDQRENRRVAAGYFRGRPVLDLFCYSGGFSLCASRLGGAVEVLGVDSSPKAIALAKANAELNEVTNVRFECGDAFRTLESLAAAGKRFGGIVLDPPKFARRRQAVEEALRAYHKLNCMALDVLEPGGVLVTCSCSGHVSREDFLHTLADVAQRTGRDIQILEQRGASPDHPTSATCLESEYLKCFVCRVG
ncbi:MAG TPA: class I SAM-dependent rRNA methyltransferase [Pirellulales bacterium]|nr:class I SAM-dependent rRNA methyltransferase [Pirellulales bacterium]